MKKLISFFFILLAMCFAFQACDDTKTYAEMLEDEDNAIAEFISKENIKVISQTEFYDNDSVTNVEENEFVQLASGVYMQIVDKGSDNPADTVKDNDLILVRFMEYSLLDKDTTLSNLSYPYIVDEFKYTATSSSIAGIFTQGLMYSAYGYTAVPAGGLSATCASSCLPRWDTRELYSMYTLTITTSPSIRYTSDATTKQTTNPIIQINL